jgi:uncharacterized protein involved in exopolysaccharide biosynthesis
MNSVIIKTSFEPPSQSQFAQAPAAGIGDYKKELLRSIRMHKVLAVVTGLFVFLLLLTSALRRPPYYETSALVYVQPMQAKQLTDLTAATYDPSRYDSYIEQQLQTIVRSDTLTAALQEAAKQTGRDVWSLPNESQQSAITRLQHDLKVSREMGSYQLSISLSGSDPAVITTIVNAVADSYINQERKDELAQSSQQLQTLEDERQRIQVELDKDRTEQASLSTDLGVADPAGDDGNPYDSQLKELRTQLAEAHSAHAAAEAQLASVSSSNALTIAAEDSSASDPGLAALKQTISQRRSTLAIQMAGLTPKSPLYKQDQEELNQLDQSLDKMSSDVRTKAAQQYLGKLKLEAARTGDIEARLASQLQRQTAIATSSTPKLQRAATLAADVLRLQGRFTEVDSAISALELEHGSSGLVHLLLHATQPTNPVSSKKDLIILASLPFGIFCGVAAAFLKHKLDPRVYIGSEVAKVLSFPPMAVMPKPEEVDAKVLDEFMLRLVAGIDQAHCSGGARTYLFTAASASTDISKLVASLATKMDRLGYRTMISKASDVLQNLSLGAHGEPTIWNDGRYGQVRETRLAKISGESYVVENLERMKQNVDILFIEALPFLSSTETEFAARLADVTLIVAESAKTTRDELARTLALAKRLSVQGLAAVLDNVELRYADDEFIDFVTNVVSRQASIARDETANQRRPTRYPLSIYASEDSATAEQKAATDF